MRDTEREVIVSPQPCADPGAVYLAQEHKLRQHGYTQAQVLSMTAGEVFSRLAVINAYQHLESRQGREQAWFQKHRAQKHAPGAPGSGGMEVPGMDEAGAWL